MNKITLYYSTLLLIIGVQFVSTVISKSIAVQQSAALADHQRELARLEQQEATLVNQLAQQTSYAALQTGAQEFVAISNPVTIEESAIASIR